MERKKVEYEDERKKISYEMMKNSHDIVQRRGILYFKIILVILILALIRGINGEIIIENPFGYSSSVNRFYELKINGDLTCTDIVYNTKIPIIPFVVSFNSSNDDSFVLDSGMFEEYELKIGDKVELELKTYECYYKKNRVRCRSYKDKTTEKKAKYKKLVILEEPDEGEYKEVYNGKYITDISKYIKKKGYYTIEVTGKYKMTNFSVTVFIKAE